MENETPTKGYIIGRAFLAWFKNRFENCPNQGAVHLQDLFKNGEADNVIWPLLETTGDSEYTNETFLKVSKSILKGDIK